MVDLSDVKWLPNRFGGSEAIIGAGGDDRGDTV